MREKNEGEMCHVMDITHNATRINCGLKIVRVDFRGLTFVNGLTQFELDSIFFVPER